MIKNKFDIVAAIDIGSNFIRMTIAQINCNGDIDIIEDLRQHTHIGRDTFSFQRIDPETIIEACRVLKGFVNMMKEYNIEQYWAVATSGIREAENKEYVLEQIRVKTGLVVDIINSSQERFLMYKALHDNMKEIKDIYSSGALIVNVGSGGVEISVYSDGKLKFTEYLKVGALRLREVLFDLERRALSFSDVMEEYIESNIHYLKPIIEKKELSNFVALGGSIKSIYHFNFARQNKAYIDKDKLMHLYSSVKNMTTEQLTHTYKISSSNTQLLLPSLTIFTKLLKMTKAEKVYTPMVSLRHGMLAEIVDERYNTKRKKSFEEDIISSAWYIGNKYGVDKTHSKQVKTICSQIFDSTKDIHGLGEREKFYLKIAAILHDVGKYVSLNDDDKHCYKIILSEDIMGLSNREVKLIANISRYHEEEVPKNSHKNYNTLSMEDKIIVSKLSAILKLAEALDISYKQKIEHIEVEKEDEKLYFIIKSTKDTLLEEWSFKNNTRLFEEVTGFRPLIKRKG